MNLFVILAFVLFTILAVSLQRRDYFNLLLKVACILMASYGLYLIIIGQLL